MCACVRLYCGECVGDNKSQSRRRVHCARACSSAKPSCSVLRTFFRKACTFHKKTISTAGGGFNMMMSKSVDVPRYFNMLILQLDYVSFVLNIFKCFYTCTYPDEFTSLLKIMIIINMNICSLCKGCSASNPLMLYVFEAGDQHPCELR